MFVVSSVNIFSILCVHVVISVSVQIDGVIDLGPNWKYEYKMESVQDIPVTKKVHSERSTTSKYSGNKIPGLRVTQFRPYVDPTSIYSQTHKVKDDVKINDFTYHVYKQSLKVFDEIKQKVDPEVAPRIDALSKSFDEKFREYINETLNQKIKTRLGSQRVILNTMDTSHRLLKRLVNYFIGDMQKNGVRKSNEIAANVLQKEVERECNLENMHVFSKFGICRSSQGFSEFMNDFFTIIIKNDPKKIKIALDALTEVAKETDFGTVMASKTKKKYLKAIEGIERCDGHSAKAMFWIAKNLFALKNQPIKVMNVGGDYVNKTVAALEVLDEFDKRLPANEENILEWTDLKNSINDWSSGKRNDILEVMQGLVSHFKSKAIDTMDSVTAKNINTNFDIIFS